jgi:dolichyl-phosphate beta-glucosyltransferase
MYLSVIIPAYNEEQRIEKTLKAVGHYLKTKNFKYEIIVVDDGSTDATADIVNMHSLIIPNLKLITNDINHGKGWVVRQGMLAATGKYRLFTDADNSTPIEQLDLLIPHAEKGCDVVIGSRRIKGAKLEVSQGFIRDFLGGIFRTLVHTLAPTGVVDSQNGFKLFTSETAEALFHRQRTTTWAFDVELLVIAKSLKFSIKEVGVRWINDNRSKVTFMGMIRMLVELLQIRINLRYNVYDKVAFEFLS